MPTYSWTCPGCGAYREVIVPMDERNIPLECECGVTMERLFTPPAIIGETCAGSHWTPWYDETLGTWIDSKATHQRELARQGLRIRDETDPALAEVGYIRKHSAGGNDLEAKAAVTSVAKEVQRKRQEKSVDRALKEAHKTLKIET